MIKEKVCHNLPGDIGGRGYTKVINGDIGGGGLIFDIFMVTSFLNDPQMQWLCFGQGLGLVSGAHFQHFFLCIFSIYNTLSIDQVSIANVIYSSRYKTICIFKFQLRHIRITNVGFNFIQLSNKFSNDFYKFPFLKISNST